MPADGDSRDRRPTAFDHSLPSSLAAPACCTHLALTLTLPSPFPDPLTPRHCMYPFAGTPPAMLPVTDLLLASPDLSVYYISPVACVGLFFPGALNDRLGRQREKRAGTIKGSSRRGWQRSSRVLGTPLGAGGRGEAARHDSAPVDVRGRPLAGRRVAQATARAAAACGRLNGAGRCQAGAQPPAAGGQAAAAAAQAA